MEQLLITLATDVVFFRLENQNYEKKWSQQSNFKFELFLQSQAVHMVHKFPGS